MAAVVDCEGELVTYTEAENDHEGPTHLSQIGGCGPST